MLQKYNFTTNEVTYKRCEATNTSKKTHLLKTRGGKNCYEKEK